MLILQIHAMGTYNGKVVCIVVLCFLVLISVRNVEGMMGEGTYNPKSAWMFVDSRRRVLPDINGEMKIKLYL